MTLHSETNIQNYKTRWETTQCMLTIVRYQQYTPTNGIVQRQQRHDTSIPQRKKIISHTLLPLSFVNWGGHMNFLLCLQVPDTAVYASVIIITENNCLPTVGVPCTVNNDHNGWPRFTEPLRSFVLSRIYTKKKVHWLLQRYPSHFGVWQVNLLKTEQFYGVYVSGSKLQMLADTLKKVWF